MFVSGLGIPLVLGNSQVISWGAAGMSAVGGVVGYGTSEFDRAGS